MEINKPFIANLKHVCGRQVAMRPSTTQSTAFRVRSIAQTDSTYARLQLVMSDDGVLDWEESAPNIPGMERKRRGTPTGSSGLTTQLVEFSRLQPSQITRFLAEQDRRFTPQRGLRKLQADGITLKPAAFTKSGRTLLILHGTFSNSDNMLSSFQATEFGKCFFADARSKYAGNVFAFDHPTISVGPILNAIDLQRALGKTSAKIDIICHSRGGLVARWWCETFDPQAERCPNAVLVGSPLAGTGLAAPPNIRKTLKLLTNYGHAISAVSEMASLAFPVLGLVNTLLRVITSMTSITASTPLADSIMAMIPGLFAQSRVGNNPELLRLMEYSSKFDRYSAIQSNFQPTDPAWQFWRVFRKHRVANTAADVIFDGDNDLVVDTSSMIQLSSTQAIPNDRLTSFGNSETVHHINYFEQPETIAHFRKVLDI